MVPPLTGDAVNVTEVPAQTGLADAAIETLTGSKGFTVMATGGDVTGFPVVHGSLDVSMHEIVLPFTGTKT